MTHALRLLSVFVAALVALMPLSYAQQLSGVKAVVAQDSIDTASSAGDVVVQDANDVCSGAQEFFWAGASGSISPAKDLDWWKISVGKQGKFTITLDGPSGADFDLYVHESCSSDWVCRPYESDADETCAITSRPGWYYVRVDGYSGTGSYLVSVALDGLTDLSPEQFVITPPNPYNGDDITIRYQVKNTGSQDITASFSQVLQVDGQQKPTCTFGSGLKAGWIGYCDYPAGKLGTGSHELKNTVDNGDTIAETNEGNNVKTEPMTVRPKYDLVPGSIFVTPSEPKSTDSIAIDYRAVNVGPDNVKDSFTVKLYIDSVHRQTCLYPKLDFLEVTNCRLPDVTLNPGNHELKAIVDADGSVAETNEGNNEEKKNQPVECPLDKPYYVDGECKKCPADKPKECGNNCYAGNECESGKVTICDKYGNVECCPAGWPLYCGRIDGCTKNSEQCDTAIYCGGDWVACDDPGRVESCVDEKLGCCLPEHPYYCPSNNWCFAQDGFCDGRPVYECNGKGWVCLTKEHVGTCYGDQLRCCPPEVPYWWASDGQCHASLEQQKCAVPDGTSSQCTCNSNSDCPADKPYCEENYPSPISDGYDACVASPPEYCGNGNCGGSETYNNCPSDCSQLAPKGTVSVYTVYNSGILKDKPLVGAAVYLDGAKKGNTGSDGKLAFEAAYGTRTVKVECPDTSPCGSWSVEVKGAEFKSVRCDCNPLADSDGDGDFDADELLLGTDPNDPSSNFKSAFSSFNYPQHCLDIPGLIAIIWENKDDLIKANDVVVNALNNTAVTSTDIKKKPYALVESIFSSGIDGQIVKSNVTLYQAMQASEAVNGFFTDYGAVLVTTDADTQTTAIIAISATCVGNAIGGIYGAGTGVKDDLVGIWDLVKGLWNLAGTAVTNPAKIAADIENFMKAIPGIFGKAGEIFHDLLIGILEKGRNVNEKSFFFTPDSETYLNFQIGFTNGFVTGYVIEQVAAAATGVGAVLKALKLGNLGGKAGKILKLSAILAKVTEQHGGEVAGVIKKLKYADNIADWADAERDGLIRLAKLKQGKWLGEISEVEAKAASKNIVKLADADIDNLLKTKLGQHTLKAADATDDLLAKQAKLVSKWGVKKADEVVSKCFFFICYGDRIGDLNKILRAMPENLVDGFVPEKAVKFLGDKRLIQASEDIVKGVDKSAISNAVNDIFGYEKLLEYTKAVKKLDPAIVNPLGDIGQHQLFKVYRSPGRVTKVGAESVNDVLVLRKGNGLESGPTAWGFDHGMKHVNDFNEIFGVSDPESIKKIITEVLESGGKGVSTDPGVKEVLEKTVTYNSKTNLVRVPYVIKETSYGAIPGDIATFFPVK